MVVNGSGLTYTNTGTVTGGNGGAGGNGSGGNGGNGGDGGFGLLFASSGTLTNSGTITGGSGGSAGTGASSGTAGSAGIAVSGGNLTVTNPGTINGGGSGAVNAISFTSGTNALTLQSGSSITGNVVAFSTSDTLTLASSSNVSASTNQFQGFGAVTANSGSTLTGTGTAGSATVSGTLKPINGSTPGTLTVTNNTTFNSGSTFSTTLNSTSTYGKLSAGSVTLGGNGTLSITLGYAPSANDSFTVVSTTGGVTGTFSNAANGATLTATFSGTTYVFTVSYAANTVVLTAQGAATATPTPSSATATPTPSSATATSTPVPTSNSAAATPTSAPSGGGGGGGGTAAAPAGQTAGSNPGTPSNSYGYIANNGTLPLSSNNVVTSAASVPWATGGDIVAGSVGLSVPPQPGLPGNMSITINPAGSQTTLPGFAALPVPGGPAQYSPNGTLFQLAATDAQGNPVRIFQVPISIIAKYNSADLGQANGNPNSLTLGYFVDANTPAIMNPNGYPIGTLAVAPPSNVTLDTTKGVITFNAQAISSVFVVLTNPVGYVQTLKPNAEVFSSFDPATAKVFGAEKQFSYLRVVEPQIGTRFLVQDLVTGNYAYVNATDVGPSGPPPS